SLRAASLPHMLEVRDVTGESVRLHLLSGREQVCIEEVDSRRTPRAPRRLGRAGPLYGGPEGQVILAFLPQIEAHQIITEAQRLGALGSEREAALNEEVARIRQRGVAVNTPP